MLSTLEELLERLALLYRFLLAERGLEVGQHVVDPSHVAVLLPEKLCQNPMNLLNKY